MSTVIALKNSGMNIRFVLGFNEPDGPFTEGGSQIDPVSAATRWLSDIEPLRAYNISLGAPAVTGSVRGLNWLQSFFTACNGSCHADFLPIHAYGGLDVLQWFANTTHANYPNMTTWVTEYADNDQPLAATELDFTNSLNWLDSTPWINRYSYFGAFRSYVSNVGYNASLLDSCGNLTDIGDWYMNSPPQGYIPSPLECPYGPVDISCPAGNASYYTDPATGTIWFIECYIDHSGGDIAGDGQQTNGFPNCISLCANTTGCIDVSWTNGPCYIKSTLNPPSTNFNVWGAKLTTLPSSSSTTSTVAASAVHSTSSLSFPAPSSSASATGLTSTVGNGCVSRNCGDCLSIPSPTTVSGLACPTQNLYINSGGTNVYGNIVLPFNITLYDHSSASVYMEDAGVRLSILFHGQRHAMSSPSS
jgi:hypothetical protein